MPIRKILIGIGRYGMLYWQFYRYNTEGQIILKSPTRKILWSQKLVTNNFILPWITDFKIYFLGCVMTNELKTFKDVFNSWITKLVISVIGIGRYGKIHIGNLLVSADIRIGKSVIIGISWYGKIHIVRTLVGLGWVRKLSGPENIWRLNIP